MIEFILGTFMGSMVTLTIVFAVFCEIQFKKMDKIRKGWK